MISKDSNLKDEDDDYYEEMQMRSKLKARKGKHQKLQQIEDKVDTEGKNSIMEKSASSLSKHMRLSPTKRSQLDSNVSLLPLMNGSKRDPIVGRTSVANSPSEMNINRLKHSAMLKDSSNVALSIMNMTFNEEIAVRDVRTNRNDEAMKKLQTKKVFQMSHKRRF